MEPLKLLYIFIILAAVYLLFSQKRSYQVIEGLEAPNAAELCREISSEADNITAGMNGAAKLIDACLGPFSPNNYKSGDNATEDKVRNIITSSINPETRTQITNDCNNLATSLQSNVIDNTACEYCKTNECSISNVTQENIKEAQQNCVLNSLVSTLMQTQNDIASQSLAEAVQKAQGLLSGDNTSSSENCNVVSTDMSPKSYLEILNRCANTSTGDQANTLRGCGSMTNIIQRNTVKDIQECVISNTASIDTKTSQKAETKSESKVDQSTEGFTVAASLGIGLSCCISCIVLSLVLGFVANTATDKAAAVANNVIENPEVLQSLQSFRE
jgi:hypothetical protein